LWQHLTNGDKLRNDLQYHYDLFSQIVRREKGMSIHSLPYGPPYILCTTCFNISKLCFVRISYYSHNKQRLFSKVAKSLLVIVMEVFCVLMYELSWSTSFILQMDPTTGDLDKGFACFSL